MLSIQKMIESARECLGWPYVSPGSNDRNGIDCSGLFVKMYRDQGASIYHGSNKIARKYCSEIGKINSVSDLKVGMAVFKWKDQQPNGYNDGLGDFCHIGFVVSVNPLQIIHASSEAGYVTTDTKIGKWKYYGKLKDVEYGISEPVDNPAEEPYEPVSYASVYSDNRKSVKLRAKPSTNCALYDDVPFGAIVEIVERGERWSKVNYKSRVGWYMMSKFLLTDEESIPNVGGNDEESPPPKWVTIVIKNLPLEEARILAEKYSEAEIIAG